MKIVIAGPGCARCTATEANVRKALAAIGLPADVSHCFDVKEFPKLGVRLTPAVLVDGKVILSGRIPSVEEIGSLLKA